jgi:hypothetical protein
MVGLPYTRASDRYSPFCNLLLYILLAISQGLALLPVHFWDYGFNANCNSWQQTLSVVSIALHEETKTYKGAPRMEGRGSDDFCAGRGANRNVRGYFKIVNCSRLSS